MLCCDYIILNYIITWSAITLQILHAMHNECTLLSSWGVAMCFWVRSVLPHDVYRRFHEAHLPYSDTHTAVLLSLTIRAVYAHTLSFLCKQKHFQSCTKLLQFFSVNTWILCVLFLSRNDSGCSNHSFSRVCKFDVVFQTGSSGIFSSEFTFLLLSPFNIQTAS